MLPPLYFIGYPWNVDAFRPDYTSALVIAGLHMFFVLLLYKQQVIGPRFFIPKCLLTSDRDSYNYMCDMRTLEDEIEEDETKNCLGCMNSLEKEFDPNTGLTSDR